LTGYSGGGKKMIAEYEGEERDELLNSPRQYGITQAHKHLPEMVKITGIESAPIFSPIVGDFYSGMQVTVPLFGKWLTYGNIQTVKEIYADLYQGEIVKYIEKGDENGFLSTTKLAGKDSMQIEVQGNDERILLVARYDNLGKGASGAAIECMNYKLGVSPTTGLIL
jgi:N-acetyl-gamma-glutamyl-phosphate reductase